MDGVVQVLRGGAEGGRRGRGLAAGRPRPERGDLGVSCGTEPRPAGGMRPGGWLGCWPRPVTWTSCGTRAGAGDGSAAFCVWSDLLVNRLAEAGDLDGLRALSRGRAVKDAAGRLADLLAEAW